MFGICRSVFPPSFPQTQARVVINNKVLIKLSTHTNAQTTYTNSHTHTLTSINTHTHTKLTHTRHIYKTQTDDHRSLTQNADQLKPMEPPSPKRNAV